MTDNPNQKQNKTIGEKLQELALKLSKQRQLPLRLLSTVNFSGAGSQQRQNFASTIIQQFQPEKLLTILPFRRQSLPEVTRQEAFVDIEWDNFSQLNQTEFWQTNGEQQKQNQLQESPKSSALTPVLNLQIPVRQQQEIKPDLIPKRFYVSKLLENTPSSAKQNALDIDNTRLPNQPITTRIEQQKQFLKNIEQQQLVSQIEHSSYSFVDNQIKDFLGSLLKLRLPQTVKIYHNSAADSFAQKLNADAITYQDKILFRSGKYQLREPENIALLGHELTHINQVNQEVTQQNNNTYLQEEQLALGNEQKIINYFANSSATHNFFPEQQPLPQPHLPNSSISNITPSPPLPVIKTASTSRNLNTPSQTDNASNNFMGQLSPQQLEEIYLYIEPRMRRDLQIAYERI